MTHNWTTSLCYLFHSLLDGIFLPWLFRGWVITFCTNWSVYCHWKWHLHWKQHWNIRFSCWGRLCYWIKCFNRGLLYMEQCNHWKWMQTEACNSLRWGDYEVWCGFRTWRCFVFQGTVLLFGGIYLFPTFPQI